MFVISCLLSSLDFSESSTAVEATVVCATEAVVESPSSDHSVLPTESRVSKRKTTGQKDDSVIAAKLAGTPSKTIPPRDNPVVQSGQSEGAITSTHTLNTALYPLSSDFRAEDFIISDHDQTILNNIPGKGN